MPDGRDASVIEAYRGTYASTGDVIAAYKVAESLFRSLHPEITMPSLLRSRVAVLIGRDLLANHREIWRVITAVPDPSPDEGG